MMNRVKTQAGLPGNWKITEGIHRNEETHLSIDEESMTLRRTVNGVVVESTHFAGKRAPKEDLLIMEGKGGVYFIRPENESKLVLGKLNVGVVGRYEWVKVLERQQM